jgi:hypothetical protein
LVKNNQEGNAMNDHNASAASNEWPVRRFLDLSTAHLRPETRSLWMECFCAKSFPGTVLIGEHGWMLHVPERNTDWDYRCGAELFAIFDKARSLSCDYVLFDADGSMIDGLPVFND